MQLVFLSDDWCVVDLKVVKIQGHRQYSSYAENKGAW